jgi:hypothetical protein
VRISEIEKIPPALAACIEDLEDGGWTEVSRPDVDPINHLPMFHRRHPTDPRITLSIRESWFDRGKVFVKVFIADVEVAMSTIVGRFTADLLVRYAETLEGVSAAVPAWMRVRPDHYRVGKGENDWVEIALIEDETKEPMIQVEWPVAGMPIRIFEIGDVAGIVAWIVRLSEGPGA